jgi:hypothetical protein
MIEVIFGSVHREEDFLSLILREEHGEMLISMWDPFPLSGYELIPPQIPFGFHQDCSNFFGNGFDRIGRPSGDGFGGVKSRYGSMEYRSLYEPPPLIVLEV